jgi:hypothetical protein
MMRRVGEVWGDKVRPSEDKRDKADKGDKKEKCWHRSLVTGHWSLFQAGVS